MIVIIALLILLDVLLAIRLFKLSESVDELNDNLNALDHKTVDTYKLLEKQMEDSYMSLNARYNVHRMHHIMKGDNV